MGQLVTPKWVGTIQYSQAAVVNFLWSPSTHDRGHSYKFEEFLLTWGDKLRSEGKMTAISAGLQRDIDKYQVLCRIVYRVTCAIAIGSLTTFVRLCCLC